MPVAVDAREISGRVNENELVLSEYSVPQHPDTQKRMRIKQLICVYSIRQLIL